MFQIDRSVAVIKPKQPFVDWANTIIDEKEQYSISDFRTDCSVILLPVVDSDEHAEAIIKDMYQDVFELELSGWIVDEEMWPENITYQLFQEGLMSSFTLWHLILLKMISKKNLIIVDFQ